jgi:hypothetical protein
MKKLNTLAYTALFSLTFSLPQHTSGTEKPNWEPKTDRGASYYGYFASVRMETEAPKRLEKAIDNWKNNESSQYFDNEWFESSKNVLASGQWKGTADQDKIRIPGNPLTTPNYLPVWRISLELNSSSPQLEDFQ